MNIEAWQEYRLINNAIEDFVNNIDGSSHMKRVVGHACRSGGKKVRPIMLMLSTQACGGDIKTSVDAALAIELIHSASLIHDDILDQGIIRRGVESAHEKYGNGAAMLAGDYLISKSIELLAPYDRNIVREFGQAGMKMAEGETIDIRSDDEDAFTYQDYFECIRKKTASLFAASAAMGAYIAGANEVVAGQFRSYGESVGSAYQIVDDLLEYKKMLDDKRSIHSSITLMHIYMRNMNYGEALHEIEGAIMEHVHNARMIINSFEPSDARDRLAQLTEYTTLEMLS